MQKRNFIFLFLVSIIFSYSSVAEAALQFLPRYQGGYGARTQDGGKDKICHPSYQYTCEGDGYSSGSGSSCNNLYVSCTCTTGYKWSGGSCVLKTCTDYGYQANEDTTKSCEEKTPRTGLTCYACTSCDSSTYQYTCTGGLNANEQDTSNKCGNNYSECSCVENAVWNNGKCECKSDYKASGTSCVLKTCEDYGYQAADDSTKECSNHTPRSGLNCWNCSDCVGTYYDCGSIDNATGGDGTACGGKYTKCKCKTLYSWDKGACTLNCTRNSCSSAAYPLTEKSATNAVSYEECTPSCSDEAKRYKVVSCASGYNVNTSGSGCVAAPVKTCEEWLIEKGGYTLVKTSEEFKTALENKVANLVVMNDIDTAAFDGSDAEIFNSNILTPAYFNSQNSQCSGTSTITFNSSYMWFYLKDKIKLDIYPNIELTNGSWIYGDYENQTGGTIVFHGNINSLSGMEGMDVYTEISVEFLGEKVVIQSLNASGIIDVGAQTNIEIYDWDTLYLGSLTIEKGGSISNKVATGGKFYWYTITANDKTTYITNDFIKGHAITVLPNGCSTTGTTTVGETSIAVAICKGKLSYLCEKAKSSTGFKDGSESETELYYCQGQTVDCGTQSCSSVVSSAGGTLVTSSNANSISGLVTKNLYLAEDVTLSKNITFANANVYSAAEEFNECQCDASVKKDPTFTASGNIDVASGSGYVNIYTKANIDTVKTGGFSFYRDTTISNLDVTLGCNSGTWYRHGFNLYNNNPSNSMSVNIGYADVSVATASCTTELLFTYYSDNINVKMDNIYCDIVSGCGAYPEPSCSINAVYDSDAKNGTFKYCPDSNCGSSSSQRANKTWINGYEADDIIGKTYNSYPNNIYPAATVTCSY